MSDRIAPKKKKKASVASVKVVGAEFTSKSSKVKGKQVRPDENERQLPVVSKGAEIVTAEKPDISITAPEELITSDDDGIVNRTHNILKQIDMERRSNPMSEESSVMYEFYRAALAETLELVPKAKRSYMRYQSQANAYAFNALVTKCQELLADIQALSDRGGTLERILEQSILPSFSGIISNLGNSYVMGTSKIRTVQGLTPAQLSEIEGTFKELAMQTAKYIQETSNALNVELRGQMQDEN